MALQATQQASVLIIEDDRNIADLIRLYLEDQGWDARIAGDGAEGIGILEADQGQIDLVLLDLVLPGMDGWEVCRWVRQHKPIPVIMLTARADIQDKLRGFDVGADDYVVKPFDPLELVARVKAVLRRAGDKDKPQQLTLPGLMVDIDSYMVVIDGVQAELTPREIELLSYLANHPGKVFTREFLLQQVWGFDFPGNTRTVDVHINRLREKLDPVADKCGIKTVWGVGYKFELGAEHAKHLR